METGGGVHKFNNYGRDYSCAWRCEGKKKMKVDRFNLIISIQQNMVACISIILVAIIIDNQEIKEIRVYFLFSP